MSLSRRLLTLNQRIIWKSLHASRRCMGSKAPAKYREMSELNLKDNMNFRFSAESANRRKRMDDSDLIVTSRVIVDTFVLPITIAVVVYLIYTYRDTEMPPEATKGSRK